MNLYLCFEMSFVQNYGPWFDIAGAGLFSVILTGMGNIKEDLSSTEWTYQVSISSLIIQSIQAYLGHILLTLEIIKIC